MLRVINTQGDPKRQKDSDVLNAVTNLVPDRVFLVRWIQQSFCNFRHLTCLSLSLVKVNSKYWALKDYSSFDTPKYDCILFLSLIEIKGESFAAKNVQFLSLVKVNSENWV